MDKRRLILEGVLAQMAIASLACAQEKIQDESVLATAKVENLIGTWERRDQLGWAGRTVTAELKFDTGGGGQIQIATLEGDPDSLEKKVSGSMTGILEWKLDGTRLRLTESDWKGAIEGVSISPTDADLLRLEKSYMVFRSRGHGDLTVRYRKASFRPKQMEEKSHRILGLFKLSGDRSFKIEPEGSIQVAGEPAVLEWIDAESGMTNYLIAKHIEYFKPGRFFHAAGGPVLIKDSLMTANQSGGSRMLLFDDLTDLAEDGSKVSMLPNRDKELIFRRGELEKAKEPTPKMKEIAGSWFRTTAPSQDGKFFHIQRTLTASDRTMAGFVSLRQFTTKPLYRELGRVLMWGSWEAEGDGVSISTELYLPRQPDFELGDRQFKMATVMGGELVLEGKDGEKIVLRSSKSFEPKLDPKFSGGEDARVRFWEKPLPNPGW